MVFPKFSCDSLKKDSIQNLIEPYKEYVVLGSLLISSLFLIFSNSNPQIAKFRIYALEFVISMQDKAIWIPKIFKAISENEELRKQNFYLTLQLNNLRFAKLENEKLRNQLDFVENVNLELISAEVISKSVLGSVNSIILNVGEKDSVEVNMPIVTDLGLVGKVVNISENYSLGQLLLDKNFNVGAKILGLDITGILTWKEGNTCILQDIPKSAKIARGDSVFTSELGTLFPKNILIGTVSYAEIPQTGISQYIEVKPSVDFLALRNVFIVKAEKYVIPEEFGY